MATVKVEGMSCEHCRKSVTEALRNIAGITDVEVDLMAKEARFSEGMPENVAKAKEAIVQIGFTVPE